ncbi:hypothetical protein VPFG_00274 [Vibrio phage nt-1]|uniref:Uncharacterized protein n=1 Tax=Vibrio phage nt-1 TaxID=115992 RepID=R9TGP4_9CAUD|nr:hypothetical protein VPFG_00274 [Vibrio phage nt-1]AGN30273.1 hypothetical protein VPFG_00274 [Vibrio phage nt-1]
MSVITFLYVANLAIFFLITFAVFVLKFAFLRDITFKQVLNRVQYFKYGMILPQTLHDELHYKGDEKEDNSPYWLFMFIAFDVAILVVFMLIVNIFPIVGIIAAVLIAIRMIMMRVKHGN